MVREGCSHFVDIDVQYSVVGDLVHKEIPSKLILIGKIAHVS
jgi:hypothetical protein